MAAETASAGNIDLNGDGIADVYLTDTYSDPFYTIEGTTETFLNDGRGKYIPGQTFVNEGSPGAVSNSPPGFIPTTTGLYVEAGVDVVFNNATGMSQDVYQLYKDNGAGYFAPTALTLDQIGASAPLPPIGPAQAADLVTFNYVPETVDGKTLTDVTVTVAPPQGVVGLQATTIPTGILEDNSNPYSGPSGPLDLQFETSNGSTFSIIATVSEPQAGDTLGEVLDLTGTFGTASTGVPCYCLGTSILTVDGEVAVERLRVGDLVVTGLGSEEVAKPVRWLGHRRINLRAHPDADEVSPVRIRAGALGSDKPHRDLYVSPGHRLRLSDTLVRAIELVNGSTIVQERPHYVEYWHVELDRHDILVAEGVEAESYLDVRNRSSFDEDVTMLHPVFDGDVADPCLPYAGPTREQRQQLVDRAEALGWTRTRDPAPWLEVKGRRIDPVRRGDRYRFSLPSGCIEARLCSRAARPVDTDPTSADLRRLGMAVVHVSLQGEATCSVALDDERLSVGFSHVEQDEAGWVWRWTDGAAHLPVAALADKRIVTTLEIALDDTNLLFWVLPLMEDAVADNRCKPPPALFRRGG